MNDEEIINEINEILVYLEDEGEYHLDKDCDTEWLLAVKEVLSFFNRQQAEIEKFKNAIKEADQLFFKRFFLLWFGYRSKTRKRNRKRWRKCVIG